MSRAHEAFFMEDYVHNFFVTFHVAAQILTKIESIFLSKQNIQHCEILIVLILVV